MGIIRQGDVLLRPITTAPRGPAKSNMDKTILAFGETTGHHHRFEHKGVVAFFKEGDDAVGAQPIGGGGGTLDRFIGEPTQIVAVTIPEGGADLIHEEHTALHVPAGTYEVVRQREYVPARRNVPDARATERMVID